MRFRSARSILTPGCYRIRACESRPAAPLDFQTQPESQKSLLENKRIFHPAFAPNTLKKPLLIHAGQTLGAR